MGLGLRVLRVQDRSLGDLRCLLNCKVFGGSRVKGSKPDLAEIRVVCSIVRPSVGLGIKDRSSGDFYYLHS